LVDIPSCSSEEVFVHLLQDNDRRTRIEPKAVVLNLGGFSSRKSVLLQDQDGMTGKAGIDRRRQSADTRPEDENLLAHLFSSQLRFQSMRPSLEFRKRIINAADEFIGMIFFTDNSNSPDKHPCSEPCCHA
jgi:hypothetical protein